MKKIEQLHAQAIDGKLDEADHRQLLKLLAAKGESPESLERDRRFSSMIGAAASRPTLDNPDFFNHSLIDRIRREDAAASRSAAEAHGKRRPLLPLQARLAWGGAACLAAALALTLILKPYETRQNQTRTTRILALHEFAKGTSATAIASPSNHYAIVWIDGIDHLPSDTRIP